MMSRRKQIGQMIMSVLLLVALMSPTVAKFGHVCEGHYHHHHDASKETGTDIHQGELECQICDLQLISFQYTIIEYPTFLDSNIPSEMVKLLTSLPYTNFQKSNTQLRAPPYVLV